MIVVALVADTGVNVAFGALAQQTEDFVAKLFMVFSANDQSARYTSSTVTLRSVQNQVVDNADKFKQLLNYVHTGHNEFFSLIDDHTAGGHRPICHQNQLLEVSRNTHYNGVSVNASAVITSHNITDSCVNINESLLVALFEKMQAVGLSLHRKLHFVYYDANLSYELRYPYSYRIFQDNNRTISQRILQLQGQFSQYEVSIFFKCGANMSSNAQPAYRFQERITIQQSTSDSDDNTAAANNTYINIINELPDTALLSATCYDEETNQLRFFGGQFKGFLGVKNEYTSFLNQYEDRGWERARSNDIFKHLSELVTRRQLDTRKRIYLSRQYQLFQGARKRYDSVSHLMPLNLVIKDVGFVEPPFIVQQNYRAYMHILNDAELKKANIFMVFLKNKEIQPSNSLSDFFEGLSSSQTIYTTPDYMGIEMPNRVTRESIILGEEIDQFQQRSFSVCGRNTADVYVHEILCTVIPYEQLLFSDETQSLMQSTILADTISQEPIFSTGSTPCVYSSLIQKMSNNGIYALAEQNSIYKSPDGLIHLVSWCTEQLQLVLSIIDQAYNTFLFAEHGHHLDDDKLFAPTSAVGVCFNQQISDKCSFYVYIHENIIESELSSDDTTCFQSSDLNSSCTYDDIIAELRKKIAQNRTWAADALQAASTENFATYVAVLTTFGPCSNDSVCQAGRLYKSGVLSVYPFINLSSQMQISVRDYLLLQNKNKSLEDHVLHMEQFYGRQGFTAAKNIYLAFWLYPHRIYVDFIVFMNISRFSTDNSTIWSINFAPSNLSPVCLQILYDSDIVQCKVIENDRNIQQMAVYSTKLQQLEAGKQIISPKFMIHRLQHANCYIFYFNDSYRPNEINFNCTSVLFSNRIAVQGAKSNAKYYNVYYGQQFQGRSFLGQESITIIITIVFLAAITGLIMLIT